MATSIHLTRNRTRILAVAVAVAVAAVVAAVWLGQTNEATAGPTDGIVAVEPYDAALIAAGWDVIHAYAESRVAAWSQQFGIESLTDDELVEVIDRLTARLRASGTATDHFLVIRELMARRAEACMLLASDRHHRDEYC